MSLSGLLFCVPRAVGLPDWLFCVVLLLVALYIYGTRSHGYLEKLGVRHPPPWPLVGNLPVIWRLGFAQDTKLVEQYGRIFGFYEGGRPVLVVADADAVREICIKEFSHFVNRRTAGFPMPEELKHALSIVKDAEWKSMRNVISPTFSGSKLRRITPLIVECADRLVAAVGKFADQNEEAEVKELCGTFTMDVIARTQFGITLESSDAASDEPNDFVKYAKRMFGSASFRNPVLVASMLIPGIAPLFERLGIVFFDKECTDFFRENIYGIIAMREQQKEKPMDFLQIMLEAHDTETNDVDELGISAQDQTHDVQEQIQDWRVGKRALSRQEILGNCMIFLLAGYETTATALSWALHQLAVNPDIQERLFDEVSTVLSGHTELSYPVVASMPYLDSVFSETLRLFPPAQRSDRVCQQQCQVAGVTIPEGLVVNFSIWAIHHDADYWPEPDKFDPDRFSRANRDNIHPYSFMPFGVGPRSCVGMRLAILEAKVALVRLIRTFRFVKSDNTEDPPILKVGAGFSAAKNGVRMRVKRRD